MEEIMDKDKKNFTVKVSFNKDGESFQEILEKIIFDRIKNDMEDNSLLK